MFTQKLNVECKVGGLIPRH